MRIVDAQVHIWSGGKPGNANHRQVEAYTAADLLKEMDAAGVDGAVIHHLGRPSGRKGDPGLEDDIALWSNLPQVLALAKHPNIALKATGAPSYSSEPYPHRNIHDHPHRIFDAFGPSRMFWGTDITRMKCSWRQCVTMFTEELPWLKGRDLQQVMGGAVTDWLGWKAPAR
jgi:predicted TIM-barrel fold metal-dependent hydrolase